MRLTLRTLLAYLDDMLEPADADELRKKIDESEFATSLVNRIHDVMRRLRIGAPKVHGRGMGADPNTVAEYLEDTLSPERVLEFERVCLESDVHLAEVAACHQILTLVLGEPAEVDPQIRERMYQLTSGKEALRRAESARAGVTDLEPSAAALPPQEEIVVARHVPEVPDYLREAPRSTTSVWVIAGGVMLMGLLTGMLLVRLGVLGRGPATLAAVAPQAADEVLDGEGAEPSDDAIDAAGETARSESQPSAEGAQPAPDDLGGGDRGPAAAAEPAEEDATQEAPDSGDPTETDAAPTEVDVAAGDHRPTAPVETVEPGPSGSAAADDETAAEPPTPDRALAARPVRNGLPTDVADPLSGLGRALNQQMLLRYHPQDGLWKQAAAQVIYPGDVVASLPLFRSTVTLSARAMLHVLGGTEVEFSGPDAEGVTGLGIPYGRVILATSGVGGVRLRLNAAGGEGLLTFSDPESTVALEVSLLRDEGSDPEQQPPLRQVSLYVDRGSVLWQSTSDGQEQSLGAPLFCLLDGGGRIVSSQAGELADWINADPSSLDKKAVENVLEALSNQADRPVPLALKELMAKTQRPEVRALVARSLGMLDEFAPLVELLSDARQRAFWPSEVAGLREGLARGPQSAAALRAALTNVRGEDAAELYRLLWGYSDEQLAGGDAARLVAYLDHDDMDLRVLAAWNLQDITGHSYYYRPEDPPAKRLPQVQKWRQRLEAGEISRGPK